MTSSVCVYVYDTAILHIARSMLYKVPGESVGVVTCSAQSTFSFALSCALCQLHRVCVTSLSQESRGIKRGLNIVWQRFHVEETTMT